IPVLVLMNVERAVTVVVFARVALGGVPEAVVVPVDEQGAVVVGVGAQRRERLGRGLEMLQRGLQEYVRVEDRRLLESQIQTAPLLGVARLELREGVDAEVVVRLGIQGRREL